MHVLPILMETTNKGIKHQRHSQGKNIHNIFIYENAFEFKIIECFTFGSVRPLRNSRICI